MIEKHLGETIDIHGGIHPIFPHHENEIAQSCYAMMASPLPMSMHNGFINIEARRCPNPWATSVWSTTFSSSIRGRCCAM